MKHNLDILWTARPSGEDHYIVTVKGHLSGCFDLVSVYMSISEAYQNRLDTDIM